MDPEQAFNYESNKHTVSSFIGLIFMSLLFGLYGLVYMMNDVLPVALVLDDERNRSDAFITERVMQDLKELTEIGPRIAGSYENEVLAVNFFKEKINEIQQQAHPTKKIEIDVQTVSSSFFLNSLIYEGINAYAKAQNVVVKLYSSNNTENSLLVNAHFDSTPSSPGGTDNGISCATILEILRKLS